MGNKNIRKEKKKPKKSASAKPSAPVASIVKSPEVVVISDTKKEK